MKTLKKTGFCAAMLLAVMVLVQFCCPFRAFASSASLTLKVKSGQDITEVLQDALESGSRKIIIPRGKYKISDTLKIYSNTTLSMKGVRLTRTKKMTMLRFGKERELTEAGGYSGYKGFKNITIEGGTWDGNKQEGAIIRAGHARNIVLRNVTFKNVKKSHHVEMAACSDIKVEQCTFSGFSGEKGKSTNYEALQFDIMHNQEHFDGYGKYDDTPCKNITVTNCTFKNLQRGVGTHSAVAGSYFTNIDISNNSFTNIEGYAIIATNFRTAKIDHNTITDCGSGIFFRNMTQDHLNYYAPRKGKVNIIKDADTKITNNTISLKYSKYPNVAFGISLYGENLQSKSNGIPKGDYRVYKVTVKKNKITLPFLGYGIWLQGATKTTVDSNTINCNIKSKGNGKGKGDGIRMEDSPSNKIIHNTIKNKKASAGKEVCGIIVRENCSKSVVQENTVSGATKYGIAVQEKSKNSTVEKNTVSDSGIYGIATWSAFTTIKGNTISDSASKNIHLSGDGLSNAKVSDNKLK